MTAFPRFEMKLEIVQGHVYLYHYIKCMMNFEKCCMIIREVFDIEVLHCIL